MNEIHDPVLETTIQELSNDKSNKDKSSPNKRNNSKNRAEFSQLILENIQYICNVHSLSLIHI